MKYIRETFHLHNFYAFKYFVCDLLNFVNVIGQMYLLNAFFGGVSMAFGTDVLYWSEDQEQRNDPMIEVSRDIGNIMNQVHPPRDPP